jgi:hypothetical protein
MKNRLFIIVFAVFLGAVACSEDEPSCTAEEGDNCMSAEDVCIWEATHDTDIDTDTDSNTTSEEAASLAVCEDGYCECLMFAGCEQPAICAGGTDT